MQCFECNPPCTFRWEDGWTKPVKCAFIPEEDALDCSNYVKKDISIDELLKLFE
jgi:hypothetical protein